jgi:hypothetical protein
MTKSYNGILKDFIVVDIRYLCVHVLLCRIACNNIQADNTLANNCYSLGSIAIYLDHLCTCALAQLW